MNDTPQNAFDTFALVELFGHSRIAGKVCEQVIAGQGFIRVDVPSLGNQPAFTRLFGPSAIYSITPVSEEIAKAAAASMRVEPVNVYISPARQIGAGDDDDDNEQDDPNEPW